MEKQNVVRVNIATKEAVDKTAASKKDYITVLAENNVLGEALHDAESLELVGFEEADGAVKTAPRINFKGLNKPVYFEGTDIKPYKATDFALYADIKAFFAKHAIDGVTEIQVAEACGGMSSKLKEFISGQEIFKVLNAVSFIEEAYRRVKAPRDKDIDVSNLNEIKADAAALFGANNVVGARVETLTLTNTQFPLYAQHINGFYSVKLFKKTAAQILAGVGGYKADPTRYRWVSSLCSDMDNEEDAKALLKEVREYEKALRNEIEIGIR